MLEVPFKNKKESFFYVKNKLINPKKLIDELINIAKERSLIFKNEVDYENEISARIIGKYQCRISTSGYCMCDYDPVKYNNCVCDYCDDCNDCNFKTNLNRVRITVKTVNGIKFFNIQEFKNWLEKTIEYENPYKINALKAKKIADEYLKREEEFENLSYWIKLIFIRIKDNKLIIKVAKHPLIKKLIKEWKLESRKARSADDELAFLEKFKKENFKTIN